jgi:hypothetical protein
MHDWTHKINTEYGINIHKMKHNRYEQEPVPPELRHVEVVEKEGTLAQELELKETRRSTSMVKKVRDHVGVPPRVPPQRCASRFHFAVAVRCSACFTRDSQALRGREEEAEAAGDGPATCLIPKRKYRAPQISYISSSSKLNRRAIP